MKITSLVAILCLLFTVNALACSCAEIRGNAQEVLADSTTAFIGIPITESTETGVRSEWGEEETKTTFKVVKNFKASNQPEVEVYSTKGNGANCGTYFPKNSGPVLVFTYMIDGKLETSSCSTLPISYDPYSSEVLLELL